MQYSLGIDAGGTYTDAVLIRDTDGAIIDSNKALTTYPDLHPGIKNVIDGLNPEYLKNIKLVSVSTTLSTNTILGRNRFSSRPDPYRRSPLRKAIAHRACVFCRRRT